MEDASQHDLLPLCSLFARWRKKSQITKVAEAGEESALASEDESWPIIATRPTNGLRRRQKRGFILVGPETQQGGDISDAV